ncbi:MAG TPA: DHA2 family efflux MFS transporter permease subunit [Verrucomicrobiae bacterium]|nr:DHA2 family efflux MFS transporter permease subunit [Verrucomicrobiae bacterium]HTZ54691.1 DHA2 family efflux MFS transporter permease subunit [Candidatus Acidoferrum sp.]
MSASTTPPRREVTETGLRRVLIVAGVMAAALMQTLDSTITNVALPTIQGNLGASQEEGTWIVTAYVIAAIVVIPLTPWLQNRFGRKNYFVASIAGFTIASVVCGSADSLTLLIIARFVQGAFGGGLLATSQSILRDTFPPKQLGLSQGIFALGAIMGPALGPPLGGILVDNYSWNWVFDINIAPGIFSAIVLALLLRDPEPGRAGKVDFVGLLLLAAGLGSMQYVLTEGELHYWFADPAVLALSIVMVISLCSFVYWELFATQAPIVDLRILRNRSVAAGSILGLTLGVAVFGSTYILPQFTQGPLGFTPTLSGLLFMLRALPIMLMTPLIVRFVGRIDPRVMLGSGFLLVGFGSWLQATVTNGDANFWSFAPALITTGIGSALLFIPLSIAVLGATTPQEGPKAAAFINLSLQLGGSISVAALDVIIDRRWSYHSSVLGADATLQSPAVHAFLQHGGTIEQLAQLVNGQAAILAYADATMVIAVVCLLCSPLVLFMRRRRQPATPAGESRSAAPSAAQAAGHA